MSQVNAQTAVMQAFHDEGEFSPYGSASAQVQSGTVYVAVPIELANYHQIQQGNEIQRAHHAKTGTLLVSLRQDVDLFSPQKRE